MSEFLFSGLKVLDLGTFIASPGSATLLADFGADVIKVEPPGEGDTARRLYKHPAVPRVEHNHLWELWGRNKRSLSLNLKSPVAIEILRKLAAECDVLITNMPGSVRRKLTLDYEDVKALNTEVIYASFSAFGEEGPEGDGRSYDFHGYWNRAGLMDGMRNPGMPPSQIMGGMGDQICSISIYASIVTALLKRERTGKGSFVQTSLLANGIWAAGGIVQGALAGANLDDYREARNVQGPIERIYQTSDDRWFQLSLLATEAMILSLLEVLGVATVLEEDRFSTPQRREENRGELSEVIQQAFLERSSAEWLKIFDETGLPAMLVATLPEVIADEQLELNDIVIKPDDDGVDVPLMVNHPINIGAKEQVGPKRAPGVGEHTEQILAELGYDEAQIAQYRKDGAV